MCHYGSASAKRQKAYTNNVAASKLDMGKLRKKQRERLKLQTTIRTKDGGFQGSKALKGTQWAPQLLDLKRDDIEY